MPSKPVLAARSMVDSSCIIDVPNTSRRKSPNTALPPPNLHLHRTQERYDPIPNGCRNACFGHYWQVFHCTICMKDKNLIGICPKATIRAAHVVCHQQIQAL